MCLAVSPKAKYSVQPSVVFINVMPDAITSLSKMFAVDAKVFRQIETSVDTATLENDLDHLTDWFLKWQMNFNVNKCKRLHIGPTNPHNTTTTPLQVLSWMRAIKNDLGIIVDNKFKFHIQTTHIVNKGFSILGVIKKKTWTSTQFQIQYCIKH